MITHVTFSDGVELFTETHIHGRGDELAMGDSSFVVRDAFITWAEGPRPVVGIDVGDSLAVQFLVLAECQTEPVQAGVIVEVTPP